MSPETKEISSEYFLELLKDGHCDFKPFGHTRVVGHCVVADMEITKHLRFGNLHFTGSVRFTNTTIKGDLSLDNAKHLGAVHLGSLIIENNLCLEHATLCAGISLDTCTIAGHLFCDRATIKQGLFYRSAHITGDVHLSNQNDETSVEHRFGKCQVDGDIRVRQGQKRLIFDTGEMTHHGELVTHFG